MKFEWDINKETLNLKKHGVSFEQAAFVFADPYALSIFDKVHSGSEDRWVLLGKTSNELILVVVHTFRDDDGIEMIRIISARKATSNEKSTYEKRRL
ncbi:MAG: BrnT family toxin [Candidatus Delongbacteria bacterium]